MRLASSHSAVRARCRWHTAHLAMAGLLQWLVAPIHSNWARVHPTVSFADNLSEPAAREKVPRLLLASYT
jgi:hypothetical protein